MDNTQIQLRRKNSGKFTRADIDRHEYKNVLETSIRSSYANSL